MREPLAAAAEQRVDAGEVLELLARQRHHRIDQRAASGCWTASCSALPDTLRSLAAWSCRKVSTSPRTASTQAGEVALRRRSIVPPTVTRAARISPQRPQGLARVVTQFDCAAVIAALEKTANDAKDTKGAKQRYLAPLASLAAI